MSPPGAPTSSSTAAQITGFLHLNSAYPSIPGDRILVDAASPVEAVRKGLFGRVGVHAVAFKWLCDYWLSTTSTNAADHKPFLVELIGDPTGGTVKIKLEDLAGVSPNHPDQPDWDYNDAVWEIPFLDTAHRPVPQRPQPMLEVLDKDNAGMTDLKVGKWDDAFTATPLALKANFIDDDMDRYKVRVTHTEARDAGGVKFTANNTTDTVTVGLGSHSDSATR